ncbi:MAG: PAS domain S-box protein [Methanolobus sp.]
MADSDYKLAKNNSVGSGFTKEKSKTRLKSQKDETYRLALENSLDGYLCITPDGKITDVNRSYCNLTGYTRKELLDMTVFDLEVMENNKQTKVHFQNIIEKGNDFFETKHRTKDGKVLDIEASITYLEKDEPSFHCFLRDRTEYVKTEKALCENEEKLRITLRSIGDAVISTDLAGNVVSMNPTAENLTGWKENEACNIALEKIFRIVNSKTYSKVENPVKEVLKTGKIVGLANHTKLIARNGKEFHIADSGAPIKDEKGNITGVVIVFRDVTESYRMQEEIRKSEEKYRSLVDSSDAAISMVNPDGHYLYLNSIAADNFGMIPEEMIGMHVHELFSTDEKEKIMADVKKVIETDSGMKMETEVIIGGERKWYRTSVQPVRNELGQPFAALIYSDDISERKEAEEALRQSEALLSEVSKIAMIGGWEIDMLTGNSSWTHETPRIHELDNHEAVGVKNGLSYYPPESRKILEKAFSELAEKAVPYDLELEFVTAKGNQKWVRTSGRPEVTDGKVVRITGTLQDITERKNAENRLHESEEKLKLFIEHAPASLAMFDRDMCYIAASRRWMDDFSLGNKDLHGLCHYDIFPEISDEWKNIHQRGMKGEVIRNSEDRFEREDGKVYWLRWDVRPWKTVTGNIGGIVIFSEDITEKKNAEIRVRESEERYRKILEVAPVGIAIHQDEKIVFANPEAIRLLGAKSMEDIVGIDIKTIMLPENLEKAKQRIPALIAGEKGCTLLKMFTFDLMVHRWTLKLLPHLSATTINLQYR